MAISVHRLTLRRTFIDLDVEEERVLSPRAHSDPGQTASRSRAQQCEDEDDHQQRYIEQLDELYQCDSLATGDNVLVGASSEFGDLSGTRSRFTRGPMMPHVALPVLAPCPEEAGGDSPHTSPCAAGASASVPAFDGAELEQTLAGLAGDWVAIDGPGSVASDDVWRLNPLGSVLFNGKRFGSGYDVCIRWSEFGRPILRRNDGWYVDEASSSPGRLVWRSLENPELCSVWTRALPPAKVSAKASKENTHELRRKMRQGLQEMCQGWDSAGRLGSTKGVIEDVQRRICEDMERAESYIVDSMQAKVLAMKQKLMSEDTGCGKKRELPEKVVENLEVIPTMVQNLLDARIARAREMVRQQIQGMAAQLAHLFDEEAPDRQHLAIELTKIATEAVRTAGDAVGAAALECQTHAAKQLDMALAVLGRQGLVSAPSSGEGKQAWEVGHDPWRLSRTIAQALAVVQDKDHIPQSFANQVVADQLLRARIRSGGAGDKNEGSRMQSDLVQGLVRVTNPGSKGHPDICRPCVFHGQGSCTKGDACNFCHIAHPKRPVRFDKLHRDSLRKMPFLRLVQIMLPVFQTKYSNVQAHLDTGANEILTALWTKLETMLKQGENELNGAGLPLRVSAAAPACLSPEELDVARQAAGTARASEELQAQSRRDTSLVSVLSAMTLRPLLATLASKAPTEDVDLRRLIEEAIAVIHGKRKGGSGTAAAPPIPSQIAGGGGGDVNSTNGPDSREKLAKARLPAEPEPELPTLITSSAGLRAHFEATCNPTGTAVMGGGLGLDPEPLNRKGGSNGVGSLGSMSFNRGSKVYPNVVAQSQANVAAGGCIMGPPGTPEPFLPSAAAGPVTGGSKSNKIPSKVAGAVMGNVSTGAACNADASYQTCFCPSSSSSDPRRCADSAITHVAATSATTISPDQGRSSNNSNNTRHKQKRNDKGSGSGNVGDSSCNNAGAAESRLGIGRHFGAQKVGASPASSPGNTGKRSLRSFLPNPKTQTLLANFGV